MLKTIITRLIHTLDETNLQIRLLIILGSITFLWFILGLIYLFIRLYHYCKEKRKNDYFLSSSTCSKRPKQEPLLDADSDDDDDERMSILTSISWVSNQTKTHLSSIDASSITAISSNITALSTLTKSSCKSSILPTVMVTDCDRLQTDIIELDYFESLPRTSLHRSSRESIDLRLLLNDRKP